MENTENKRSVILGIFVLLGIVFFVLAVFTLAGQQKRFVKSIGLTAIFDDVSGLKVGNNVWFSGVKVGTVKSIDFYGNSQVRISMNVEEEAQKYIHKNATASISSEGFIGNKIIVIDGGSPAQAVVEDGDNIRVKTSVSTDQIMSDLQKNNKNLIDITSNLKIISGEIANGQGTVGALLSDSVMATNMKSTVSGIRSASENINNTAVSLSMFANKLNAKGGLVDKLLTDTVVFSNLKYSSEDIRKLGATAASLSEDLKVVSGKLKSPDNPVGLLLNDQESAASMKTTIKNLETSSKKLDQNLKALQHNFLFRGYFRKHPAEQDTTK